MARYFVGRIDTGSGTVRLGPRPFSISVVNSFGGNFVCCHQLGKQTLPSPSTNGCYVNKAPIRCGFAKVCFKGLISWTWERFVLNISTWNGSTYIVVLGYQKTTIRILGSIRHDQIRNTDLEFEFDDHAVDARSRVGWFVFLRGNCSAWGSSAHHNSAPGTMGFANIGVDSLLQRNLCSSFTKSLGSLPSDGCA